MGEGSDAGPSQEVWNKGMIVLREKAVVLFSASFMGEQHLAVGGGSDIAGLQEFNTKYDVIGSTL